MINISLVALFCITLNICDAASKSKPHSHQGALEVGVIFISTFVISWYFWKL